MLGHEDQRRLDAIERQLEDDDPAFAARMRRRRRRVSPSLVAVCLLLWMATPSLGLAFGWQAALGSGALLCVLFAVTMRTFRHRPGRPPSGA
ncbi:DUF3040 domain-containing protein [Longispora albida]|uniref:DUF3040 domain-containing protein n=1 Tax=Longispora albida TaxID=203523 RepID=UPI0003795DA9|nr:DUF3040 domain-containing protein [Longispora albida]